MILNAVKISKMQIKIKYLDRSFPSKIETFSSLHYIPSPENSRHQHENFAKLFDDILSLALISSKELILLGDMKVNYLIEDDQDEIKSVISSHGIE